MGRVVIFFVQVGLLTALQLLSSSARNQEPPSRGALNSGLTSDDSGLQLDLEIALSGFPAEVQPHGLLQSGRRCVETSGDVIKRALISPAKKRQALFSGPIVTLLASQLSIRFGERNSAFEIARRIQNANLP